MLQIISNIKAQTSWSGFLKNERLFWLYKNNIFIFTFWQVNLFHYRLLNPSQLLLFLSKREENRKMSESKLLVCESDEQITLFGLQQVFSL